MKKTTQVNLFWILVALFLLQGQKVIAQLEQQYTQYMYQTAGINAAYVGTTANTEITAMYRTQWANLEGAPTTLILGVNHPIAKKNMGIGLTIIQDKIGPATQTFFKGQYGYKIQLQKDVFLSFGVDVGGTALNIDLDNNLLLNPSDGSIDGNSFSKLYMQLGAGVYAYAKNWYVGVSTPNMLGSSIYNEEVQRLVPDVLQYNIIGGYVFEVNKLLKIKPAALFHFVPSSQSYFSLSANAMYNNKFVLGTSYRFGNAFSALVGFQPNANWFLGYAHDFYTSDFANQNGGAHEIIIRYQFKKKKAKQIQTPRFF